MTAMIHSLERDCVSSLGIPVDNLSLEDAVDRITEMARMRDGRARLVSTLNVDFLVNSLGTRFTHARHPELLDVLRNSDLVTADGFPVVWLSRLVGRPVRQRVCGSDLVPALASRVRDEGLSIFLLGGGDGVGERAADRLVQDNPGLKIAGTAAPFIHTAGPGLANCNADDEAIVEQINRSGADILLIGLGNPKQELWFNRNRDRLTVPVSIGVGGTFEFITGSVLRAPAWMQRLNLEWAFRITQDPARLWRRYAHGLVKLAALSAPLLAARAAEVAAFGLGRVEGPEQIRWHRFWSNRDQALSVLRLPPLVTRDYLLAALGAMAGQAAVGTLHLLDMSRVKKVEMAAHQLLLTLAELQRSGRLNVQCLGMSRRLRRDLAVTRVIDTVKGQQGSTLDLLSAPATDQFSCSSYSLRDGALLFLGGRVSGEDLCDTGFVESLSHASRDRDCYVDLRGVTLLQSSAIVALRPFFEAGGGSCGRVLFSGMSPEIRQMLGVAGLGEPRWIISDAELLNRLCDGGEGDE